ncbi:phage head closure protein [Aerococcaceae bacterium NML191219]|nr:phage head closure protein [Aerococcaceae bacterium NML191219]
MKISGLNQRIIIEINAVQVDDIGNHINEWHEFYQCHALIDTKQASEKIGESYVFDDSKVVFMVRWCQKLSSIDSLKFRVRLNDVLYNITGIDQMNYKNRLLKLHCQKVVR